MAGVFWVSFRLSIMSITHHSISVLLLQVPYMFSFHFLSNAKLRFGYVSTHWNGYAFLNTLNSTFKRLVSFFSVLQSACPINVIIFIDERRKGWIQNLLTHIAWLIPFGKEMFRMSPNETTKWNKINKKETLKEKKAISLFVCCSMSVWIHYKAVSSFCVASVLHEKR